MKEGDEVNYHSIIGGEITSTGHKIKYIELAPNNYSSDVAWITGKSGCVAMRALSLVTKPAEPATRADLGGTKPPEQTLEDGGVNAVAERCAQHLPEYYSLTLSMENGSACVELRKDGVCIEMDGASNGDSIRTQINDALCHANGWDTKK